MKSLRIAELLQSPATDAEVVVKGWVRTKRGNKNVAFIALNARRIWSHDWTQWKKARNAGKI